MGRRRRLCRICKSRPAAMHGRCRTCDAYWRRTGNERPEEVRVANGIRRMQRDQEAENMLLYLGAAQAISGEGA